MNESRERVRRERGRAPRAALRRVALLAEGRRFREAAALLARLPRPALAAAADLPLDLLADALPHSATLIETLLDRLVELDIQPPPALPLEALAWRLAALLGGAAEAGAGAAAGAAGAAGEAARLAGAARALARAAPALPAAVDARRRQFDQAVHGLGSHGLTAGADGQLVALHAALRDELAAHVDAYKQALHKIQELSAVTAVAAPAQASHQRLLALRAADVERRLIDNASLLAAVQRAPPRLPALAAALAARVRGDKLALAAAGLARRAGPAPPRPHEDARPVAGVLMSYSRGCTTLLALMAGGAPPAPPAAAAPAPAPAAAPAPPLSPPDSASDGYHSDSDHSPSLPLSDRAAEVAGAAAQYGAAWARAAARWLPALAGLPALARAPALPHKIVFSVVVLSFRAAINLRDKRLNEVKALLGVAEGGAGANSDGEGAGAEAAADTGADAEAEAVARLEAAALRVLRAGAERCPLDELERTVVAQVTGTLREYPGLAHAPPLRALAAAAARAAWRLALLPPLRLDTAFGATHFDPERHVRWCARAGGAAAGARGAAVRSFVWPALLDGERCLFRAVVLTDA